MARNNVLFLMSDEHSKRVLGAYGNTVVQTPNLDRLAAQGTRYDAAYTNSPICVPARASLATGRYVHRIGYWDNAFPYLGSPPSWGTLLQQAGRRCDAIGKLHYRATEDPTGFDNEILPLHVLDGHGDIRGLVRRPPAKRPGTAHLAGDAGEGDSSYLRYDRDIRDSAIAWLQAAAGERRAEPWCLFVSFVCPHFPLIAPPDFFRRYDPAALPWPRGREPGDFPDHPVLKALRGVQNYEDYFRDEAHVRTAIAAYYGMVSYLDDNVGRVLDALAAAGFADDTLVFYTSDHGDNLGTRTFWGKSNMYEESAGIPFLLKGPGIRAGARVSTPVTLADCAPTILAAMGVGHNADAFDGRSLLTLPDGDAERTVLSEYHAVGSITGVFMVRFGRYKYVHYEGYRPQMFDLEADPLEQRDLALEAGHGDLLAEADRRLRAICDPAAVNARAFADQQRKIEAYGGVEKARGAGNFPYTPAPGEQARLSSGGGD